MTRKETIYQSYKCGNCDHGLELSASEDDSILFKRNVECPVCSFFMTIEEGRKRRQVEFDDPHDLFGGYIFDDKEPFG